MKLKFPFFLFLFSFLISPVYCSDVNALNVPSEIATRLGISTLAGGILATLVFGMVFWIPLAYYYKSKGGGGVLIFIVTLCYLSFCVAISWLSQWILLLIVLGIAGLFAGKIKGWFT